MRPEFRAAPARQAVAQCLPCQYIVSCQVAILARPRVACKQCRAGSRGFAAVAKQGCDKICCRSVVRRRIDSKDATLSLSASSDGLCMAKDFIGYQALTDAALRGVVRDALRRIEKQGLIGSHHFYLTFKTKFPGVDIPDFLREQYPDEMTIILQHQFWGLKITEERFEVTLTFKKLPATLVIPFPGAHRLLRSRRAVRPAVPRPRRRRQIRLAADDAADSGAGAEPRKDRRYGAIQDRRNRRRKAARAAARRSGEPGFLPQEVGKFRVIAIIAIIDYIDCMASITVRNLDDNVKNRLRRQAAEHGRSLEAEVREILSCNTASTAAARTGLDLMRPLRDFVDEYGGVELPVPKRTPMRDIPNFADKPKTPRRRK